LHYYYYNKDLVSETPAGEEIRKLLQDGVSRHAMAEAGKHISAAEAASIDVGTSSGNGTSIGGGASSIGDCTSSCSGAASGGDTSSGGAAAGSGDTATGSVADTPSITPPTCE
jgi:hypothetical protein